MNYGLYFYYDLILKEIVYIGLDKSINYHLRHQQHSKIKKKNNYTILEQVLQKYGSDRIQYLPFLSFNKSLDPKFTLQRAKEIEQLYIKTYHPLLNVMYNSSYSIIKVKEVYFNEKNKSS